MKTLLDLLDSNPQVTEYKINTNKQDSFQLFYVKGALETVRCTDTCDTEVTVYVAHGDCKGDAKFFVYPSTTPEQMAELIQEAADKALLIQNKTYALPAAQVGTYEVDSNFQEYDACKLASQIAETVFSANTLPGASLNSVEVFVTKHTETVFNCLGLSKTQVRYSAMVEAIPTYNGETESVELYAQLNFSELDLDALAQEIRENLEAVKARFEAMRPENILPCPVILHKQELAQLFSELAHDLEYSSVYSHRSLHAKGDTFQTAPKGDAITVTMAGQSKGSPRSARFDQDGMDLGSIRIIENGTAVNYFGDNRFGQYLGEVPTGSLRCLIAKPGTAEDFETGPYLEVISMSGLQVDMNQDYIGGEIRLAYYHDGENCKPVTGISISGSLKDVLNTLRLSKTTAVFNGYSGPDRAILTGMKIF